MDAIQLQQLLNQAEAPKLEFKRKWYSGASKLDDKGWGEFLKDLISLANGNVGYIGQPGFLIIGAVDKDPLPGESRETIDVPAKGMLSSLQTLRDNTLRKLYATCSPLFPDLKFEFVSLEPSKKLLVIEIPSPAGLIKLDRDLSTRGMRFRKGTVLIRIGQDICVADPTDIAALQKEFENKSTGGLPERPKVLHNLPQPDYVSFVGRKEELNRLRGYLHPKDRVWTIVIDGIGGIGKSALALEMAHRFFNEFDQLPEDERFQAIIWTSAKATTLTADGITPRQQITNTIGDIYREIATTLQEDAILKNRLHDQSSRIHRALTHKRTLLIIDNLETIDDERVNAFIRELPSPTKCVVTTRHRIDIAHPIRLSGMPRKDALSLIAQECTKKGVSLTDEQAELLYRRTGGVPLAVVWSVAQMGYGYGVKSVLHRLGDAKGDIARFCFEEAVNRIKDKNAYILLVGLSLYTYFQPNRELLGNISGLSELDRDEGLVELEKLSLINKKGDSFSVLPLVKQYVSSMISDLPVEALKKLIIGLAQYDQTSAVDTIERLASYFDSSSLFELKEKVVSVIGDRMHHWAEWYDDQGVYICVTALTKIGTESAINHIKDVAEGFLSMYSSTSHAEQDAISALANFGESGFLIGLLKKRLTKSNKYLCVFLIETLSEQASAEFLSAIDELLSLSEDEEITAALHQAREKILSRE